MKFLIELTDLFCGEPNFSWVNWYSVEADTVSQAVDKFKKYHDADWILYAQNSEYSQFISDYHVCVVIVADGSEDFTKYKQLD